jgi:hypothetical protein
MYRSLVGAVTYVETSQPPPAGLPLFAVGVTFLGVRRRVSRTGRRGGVDGRSGGATDGAPGPGRGQVVTDSLRSWRLPSSAS